MIELLDLARDGLALAVLLALPIAGAALFGALVAGTLAAVTGLQDQTIALVARSASIVAVIVLALGAFTLEVRDFTADAWARLATLGKSP